MDLSNRLGLVHALPPGRASTCGYCSPPGSRSQDESSYHTTDLIASMLTCEGYQNMIDRGWRRSGTYCYHPDLRRSCCPQYPIKLDALKYKPSGSHKKSIKRWNRYILYGDSKDAEGTMDVDPSEGVIPPKPVQPPKTRSKRPPEFSLSEFIHASERRCITAQEPIHNFEVTLEPSSYTEEKYELFELYQTKIHNDSSSPGGFKRFLVDSPLKVEPIPYPSPPQDHLPINYGSYHQMYRLDGKLIAIGVLDILPKCISSVYFMYNKEWERFSLGKISAMREAMLVKEIYDAGIKPLDALYLGFYVHSCQKMRYKGDYQPSYLADPEDYKWWPFKDCSKILDEFHYACFSHPEHSLKEPARDENPIPVIDDHSLEEVYIVAGKRRRQILVNSVNKSRHWSDEESRDILLTIIYRLGLDTSKKMLLQM